MKTTDIINEINLEEILMKLWIKYKRNWPVLSLYDRWKLTDWWKADLSKWIVTDFSEKGRWTWDRISFVEQYLSCSTAQAIAWYEDNFNIKKSNMQKANISNPIKDKWDELGPLKEEQVKYLEWRWIDYSLVDGIVKDNNGKICLPIRSVDGRIKSLQSRAITDAEQRYSIEKNTDADWLFFDWLNTDKKAIVIVEWFTDFLSLRQFTTNVVWLVNAKNDWQIDYIKLLGQKYKIYFIPDNDEAWQATIKKFKDKWIKFSLFKLENYWVKDINEIIVNFWVWEWILDMIFNDSEKPISNMKMALEKARAYKKLYKENDWHLWFTTGYPLIDKYTDWFIKWKTYLIMAYSNQWKTRFAYSLIRNMIEQKKKVFFYSLEIDTWMLFLELVWAIEKKNKQQIVNELDTIDLGDLEEYVEVYDDIRKLEAIELHIQNEKPDVVFIDFLQNVEHSGQEYEKMTDIAIRIQKLAILTGTTIISLSQVSNESRFNEWNDMMPKWSWALFASSDVIFSLWGRDWNKYLTITKNKFGQAWIDFDLMPNYSISSFWLMEIEWWKAITQNEWFWKFKK